MVSAQALAFSAAVLACLVTLGVIYAAGGYSSSKLSTIGELCDQVDDKSAILSGFCRDLYGLELDSEVECSSDENKSVTFRPRDILSAGTKEDIEAAYGKTKARCGWSSDRKLSSGFSNYGWCSNQIFSLDNWKVTIGDQSRNFCNKKKGKCNGAGCRGCPESPSDGGSSAYCSNNDLSNCCIEHDKCITKFKNTGLVDSNSRCTGSDINYDNEWQGSKPWWIRAQQVGLNVNVEFVDRYRGKADDDFEVGQDQPRDCCDKALQYCAYQSTCWHPGGLFGHNFDFSCNDARANLEGMQQWISPNDHEDCTTLNLDG